MMTAAAAITISPLACPTCKGPVDVKSRHIAVSGGAVRVYCSADCLKGVVRESQPVIYPPPPRRKRTGWWVAAIVVATGGGLGAAYAVQHYRAAPQDLSVPAPSSSTTVEPRLSVAPAAPALEASRQREQDKALVTELMSDAWIHPLAGPNRRMPTTHNGAFGAERAGERNPECVSGHCGVDLGRVWGEPIYAVHDGVIDFVQRGPNEERGGMFVRIAHRNGTLFSWYFHLAAIPRSIKEGSKISVGQVVGLLGDTGVKHSAPHLHFALSVKPSKTARERYLDPEPLVAIWPLWIPGSDGTSGQVSTMEEPGIPMRGDKPTKKKRKRKSKKADKSDGGDDAGESAPSASEAPAAATAPAPTATP